MIRNIERRIGGREAVGVVLCAAAYGALIYCLDSYVFPACHIRFKFNELVAHFVPLFVVLFLTIAIYPVLGLFVWFVVHDRWRVATSLIAAIAVPVIVIMALC